MNTIIVDIPDNFYEPLKDSYYDVESYKVIMDEILNLISKKDNVSYEILDEIRKNYKKALIAYDQARVDFELDFIKVNYPNAVNWNATFGDRKVSINF